MHDHIEWAKHLIEYVLGHVLFDIWIYVNLAFKSLNGLLIDPHLIQKVIVLLSEYCWWYEYITFLWMGCWLIPINSKVIVCTFWILTLNMMIRMYLIMLEYLLVLIVDVWTSKIVNLFNLFVEAMNDLMITIVENMNILNRIILLVMETLIVFYWNYMEWAN